MSTNTFKTVFVHEINLKGDDDFSERFNLVGEYYKRAEKEDTHQAWESFYQAKYCLEQGLHIATLQKQ